MASATLATVLVFGALLAVLTEEGRAPTKVLGASANDGGRQLRLSVDSCLGKPKAEVLSEDETQVVISVISDVQTGVGPACLDAVVLRLNQPLGERELVDNATGRAIWLPPAQRG